MLGFKKKNKDPKLDRHQENLKKKLQLFYSAHSTTLHFFSKLCFNRRLKVPESFILGKIFKAFVCLYLSVFFLLFLDRKFGLTCIYKIQLFSCVSF